MGITLYTDRYCPYSVRAEIALNEKKVKADIIEISDLPIEQLKKITANKKPPILKEKNYTLSNKKILLTYINERFPTPGLLPNVIDERIKIRLCLSRIDSDWCPVVDAIKNNRNNKPKLKVLFKEFKESLISMERFFAESNYFISSSFTLVDCTIAALFTVLEAEGFVIDKSFGAVYEYKKNIFARESVKKTNSKDNIGDSLIRALEVYK